MAGLSLKDRVRNSDTRSRAASPEVVRASDQDASGIPFLRVVFGQVRLGAGPGVVPGLAGWITYPGWLERASGSPGRSC